MDELNSIIEQLKRVASQASQQHANEVRMLQRRNEDLEKENEQLKRQLLDMESKMRSLNSSLDSKILEVEQLKTRNETLTRTISDRDQEISKYTSLNQSLRSILDSAPQSVSKSTDQNFQAYDLPPSATPSRKSSARPMTPIHLQPSSKSTPLEPSSGSKSAVFIKQARATLTQTQFSQVISEINSYNKHRQNREDTITHVKRILTPDHSDLFEMFVPMISGI